jgi:ferredoxin
MSDNENKNQSGNKKVGAVMVVGGGICGMQSALDLANSGFKVYLVEETSSIGGRMAQLDKTFPTNDCSMCMISPKLIEVDKHSNIELITNARVETVEGEEGNFRVKVLKNPRYVDMAKCTGCGLCTESNLTGLKETESEIWVDRIKIDEAKCAQCGECTLACLKENKAQERQALSNIALQRRTFIGLPAEKREVKSVKSAETLWQRVALMDEASRAQFWQRQLSKCIKCYGCYDCCPVCLRDEWPPKNFEWVTPGKLPPEFPVFHLIRAYSVANACINCGECEATCPMAIPLRTLQQLIWRQPPEKIFEFVPGLDEKTKDRLIMQVREHDTAIEGVKR